MRIHTNVLTDQHFINAARRAGVTLVDCVQKGSKSRARAFDFYLSGNGKYGGQWGSSSHKTASWDEWGMVLADLFTADPRARIAGVYESAEHFHWSTGDRFTALTPPFQHVRHKWMRRGRVVTGSYYVSECENCEAVHRWMAPGYSFDELVTA